jgi:hypothetical protein
MHIQKIKFIILFIIYSVVCNAQSNEKVYLDLEVKDTYLLNFQIDSILGQVKCKCCWNEQNEKKYFICKVKVNEVLFQADSSIYTKKTLEDVKFVLLPNFIEVNTEVKTAFLTNSDNKEYLIFNRFINIEKNVEYKYKHHAHVIGLIECNGLARKVNKIINTIPR